MGFDLTNTNIKDTYQKLTQISGSVITDGTGSLIDNLTITASNATSASYAVTASFALNANASTLQEVLNTGNQAQNSITLSGSADGNNVIINPSSAGEKILITSDDGGGSDNRLEITAQNGDSTSITAVDSNLTLDSTTGDVIVNTGELRVASGIGFRDYGDTSITTNIANQDFQITGGTTTSTLTLTGNNDSNNKIKLDGENDNIQRS